MLAVPHHRLIWLVLCFGVVACEPEAATAPSTAHEPIDHALGAPVIDADDLVLRSDTVLPLDPASRGPQPSDVGGDIDMRPLQQVFSPRSHAIFQRDALYYSGQHSYIGNLSRIESTANVMDDDRHYTSQTVARQQYTPFAFDFGRTKQITLDGVIAMETTCGFSARVNSQHSAWWQFFQGRGAPLWGKSEMPSFSSLVRGVCDRETGERNGTREEPGGRVCSVLITYDLDTGEILGVQILSCYNVGGGLL